MSNSWLLLGRTGDLIACLPFLKHEADAGEKPTLVVSNQHSDLFDGVSYVNVVPFDGGIHLLKEAFDFTKAKFPDVKSLQVIGQREVVAEVTYKPAGQDCAKTTSFVKEMWKLAGKMSLWDEVLPLCFDRRSPEREAKLLQDCGLVHRGRKKKLILLSCSGTSSPFPYVDLLRELIQLKFSTEFKILELPKAERIYDLLAIYERAHCLVATDSAPLHLARACPDLPVIALTNDRPILWNGSPWMPQWAWGCRYHDFPERATQMLEAIATCRDKPELPFIHVWNEYDGKRKPHRFTADVLPVFRGMCGRDSANTIKDNKRIPYLKDCLRMGLQRAKDNELVCLSRPDTQIGLYNYDGPAFSYRMTRNEGGDDFSPIADFFCADNKWWKENLSNIPDMLLGDDYFWSAVLWCIFKQQGAKNLTGICWRPKTEKKPELYRDIPRIKHNHSISAQFFKDQKDIEDYPRVAEQVQVHPLETDKLFKWGYNPTLIEHASKLWLCYRYHSGSLSTRLALAEIHSSGKVFSNRTLDIPGKSVEDPKFFTVGSALYLSWVETKWPDEMKSVVKFAPLVNGSVGPSVQLLIGDNNWLGMEKNWCFFERDGGLFCVYQRHPVQKIFRVDENIGTPLPETPSPKWPYGALKGGGVPVEYDGKLLTFCHSRLDNELHSPRHRYYMAAVLMNPKPPFECVAVSRKPIVCGSRDDILTLEERKQCIQYKPRVVFDGGLALVDDYWLLSLGENDCNCVIAKIRANQLNF